MLTNPWETEVVGSLGVKLAGGRESRCPIAPMVAAARESAAVEGLTWTAAALARLDRIPEMVRPMAREGIERYARGVGRTVVDEELLAEARAALPG
jgi:hypothetical protein